MKELLQTEMLNKGINADKIDSWASKQLNGAGNYQIEKIDPRDLPIWQYSYVERTPLSDETAEKLKGLGWDQDIIDKIGCEEEAKIYLEADLECQEVNGKPALTKTDIDPNLAGPDGKTNSDRMSEGKAPYYIDENGKFQRYELHHVGQKNDSPLAELTKKEHIQDGNDKILHPNQKESEIDRVGFTDEREAHWKARAEQMKEEQL